MSGWTPRQRLTLWVALLAALFMFIFPPMGRPGTYGRNEWDGYKFLFAPEAHGLVTDWTRLFVQYALLAGIAWFIGSYRRPGP